MKFLVRTWPAIEDPERSEKAWTEGFPGIDLLVCAKEASVHERATGNRHDNPAAFLHGWFKRAAKDVARNGHTPATNGSTKSAYTLALERKSREDDEREAEHNRRVDEQAKNPAQLAKVRELVSKVTGRKHA